ncbi:hypothetical protein E2C01_053199 [Portunus trituberculatus]|uniref:Uncharacterized protein n=1 Tax=Portunus trituberculatus TaxID=210409 RepID=A0A5B7GNP5_PORTR|nr:hypothetical protein [Portunus trituberculatus]
MPGADVGQGWLSMQVKVPDSSQPFLCRLVDIPAYIKAQEVHLPPTELSCLVGHLESNVTNGVQGLLIPSTCHSFVVNLASKDYCKAEVQ